MDEVQACWEHCWPRHDEPPLVAHTHRTATAATANEASDTRTRPATTTAATANEAETAAAGTATVTAHTTATTATTATCVPLAPRA